MTASLPDRLRDAAANMSGNNGSWRALCVEAADAIDATKPGTEEMLVCMGYLQMCLSQRTLKMPPSAVSAAEKSGRFRANTRWLYLNSDRVEP
jgi:hypothetical protein